MQRRFAIVPLAALQLSGSMAADQTPAEIYVIAHRGLQVTERDVRDIYLGEKDLAVGIKLAPVLGIAPLRSVPAAEVINPSLYAQPWIWTEDSGRQVSLSAWRGQLVFLSMAYSSCRNTCAMTFHTLDLLQERLDRSGLAAQMVVVSYDPENDTAAAWAAFRQRRHLRRANWHFLSGDPRATRRMATALGLGAYWSADRHVIHDFRIVLLDGDGRIARTLNWNDSLDEVLP